MGDLLVREKEDPDVTAVLSYLTRSLDLLSTAERACRWLVDDLGMATTARACVESAGANVMRAIGQLVEENGGDGDAGKRDL